MELRFIERSVPAPEHGPNISRTVKVLQVQKRWEAGDASFLYWDDVPLVKEGDE